MDKKKSLIALSVVALGSVAYNLLRRVRSKVAVVEPFDIAQYLGTWYEIARLDFRWEKNLKNVTATYSMREDGMVKVNNQGVKIDTEKHKQSIGKARFADSPNQGALLVSFFGPFYAGYNIVQLDENYQDALIFGDNLDYMWILSRNKTLSKERKEAYVAYALAHGYDTSKLVWTIQE